MCALAFAAFADSAADPLPCVVSGPKGKRVDPGRVAAQNKFQRKKIAMPIIGTHQVKPSSFPSNNPNRKAMAGGTNHTRTCRKDATDGSTGKFSPHIGFVRLSTASTPATTPMIMIKRFTNLHILSV